MKINSLTAEQELQLPKFRDEWFRIGCSTAPADRPRAEAAITEMYRIIGKDKPQFIWFDSPAACIMGRHVLLQAENTKLADQSGLWSGLWSSLGSSLGSSLRYSLWYSLWSSLESSLESSLGSSLESSLGSSFVGQQNAYWVAFYVFCRDVIGVRYNEEDSHRLDLWVDIVQSCGWLFTYDGVVLISDRPEAVRWDQDETRLHCEDGPAVRFRDGWEVYSWRGTVVPREWIMEKDKLDPQTALNHPNIEQRRAAAEIIGWSRVLQQLDARVVNRDPEPEIGTLLEVDLPDSPNSRFLQVTCGTGREFVIPVPQEVQTALEANAWTYNISPLQLRDLEERT